MTTFTLAPEAAALTAVRIVNGVYLAALSQAHATRARASATMAVADREGRDA